MSEEMLGQKSEQFGFESMSVISLNDDSQTVFGDEGKAMTTWIKENEQRCREKTIILYTEHKLIFVETVTKDNKTVQIVAGLQKYENFYCMKDDRNSWNSYVVFLLNRKNGEIVRVEKGKKATVSLQKAENLIAELKRIEYSGVTKKGNYLVFIEKIEGTDLNHITIMKAENLFLQILVHILVYVILILVPLVLFYLSVQHMKKKMFETEKNFMRDSLTGGFDRDGFLRMAGHYCKEYKNLSYALIYINICDFRYINELWGEEYGNNVLKFVYQMCKENIDNKEAVCRSSIDHYLLLIHGECEEMISLRIKKIIESINIAVQKKLNDHHLDFKVGGCMIRVKMDMMTAVNHAVYAGKNAQVKNQCDFFNEKMIQEITYEGELRMLFNESIANRDFKIFLQPKVSQTESCQAEALVRWIHPEKGLISPDKFISVFERNGRIAILDLYVFEEVCRLMAVWIKKEMTITEISVNVSRFTLQIFGEGIWKKYKEIKEKYLIPDWFIEIEITETTLFSKNHISYIQHTIKGFHSCGIKVALDDFGFAYSSLGLLKALDVDTLKLDRSFFVDENYKSNMIVKSIIELSHNLGICVVAEGIEKYSQAKVLYENGCDFIQGYLYSKPLSVEDFIKWWSSR